MLLFSPVKKEIICTKKNKRRNIQIRELEDWDEWILLDVLNTFEALLDTLEEIRATDGVSDKEAGVTSGGLLSYFTKESFIFTAFTFKSIFTITDGLTKILQSPDFDLLSASEILQQKLDKLSTLRENFEKLEEEARDFITEVESEFIPLENRRHRKKKLMSGEKAADEPILDPLRVFKVETFLTAIDIICGEIQRRFIGEDSLTMGLIRDLSLLSGNRIKEISKDSAKLPTDAFRVFCKIYEDFVKLDNVRREYEQFVSCFIQLEKTKQLPEY